MLLQLQRYRADWVVRGSSLVLVLSVWFTQSGKAKGTPHTTSQKTVMTYGWGVGGVGWGLAWCVPCSASYRADGRAAISTSDRPAYYFTQNENTKDFMCSEGVLCSDAIGTGNENSSFATKFCVFAAIAVLEVIFSLSVDSTSTQLRNLFPPAVGRIMILPTASQNKRMTYTNCCIYTVVPPDDEQ